MNMPNYQFPYYNNFDNRAQPLNQYAFVNGIEGAKYYNIPLNQSMLLLDSNGQYCYIKTSNAIGQCSIKCFKLNEINENDLTKTTKNNTIDYVSKDDFNNLIKRLDEIERMVKHE